MPSFQTWKKSAIGRKINVDKAFGDQCKDVIMDYAQYLFGKPYPRTIGYGNAKDVFYAASPSYFQKIVNNPHDAKQIPRQGDIICYGAFRGNPYGHVAVVDVATVKGTDLIEQDGFNLSGKCYEKFRNYTSLPIIGWLRPRTSLTATVVRFVKKTPTIVPVYYIVHSGDTLTAIARHFRTTVQSLAKLNRISNPNLIKVGQRLRIK